MEKLVGIVPRGDLNADSAMEDFYLTGNNYAKRIQEVGGIPMGLAPVDGYLSRAALDRCDAFVVMGGKKIWPYHFQVIHHAVTLRKPYLGICLGMQLIHCYFAVRDEVERRGLDGDLCENIIRIFFEEQREDTLLEPAENHRYPLPPRGQEKSVKHPVNVVHGTLLHSLLGGDTLTGATFHSWRIHDPSPQLTVNAYAVDGTIEGVEYADHVLGVQFHPEVDDLLSALFHFLL